MIIPSPQLTPHRAQMSRLLSDMLDDHYLASLLYFKGGTCAAMRGFLDRFSVDLDFDYVGGEKDAKKIRERMEKIFEKNNLEIKDKSRNFIQYFLKYPAPSGARNTLKVDVSFPIPKSNQYENAPLQEIDRIAKCQTIETMFANKLIALIGRFEKNGSIAGRDVYDVHHFFWNGFRYDAKVIEEIRNCTAKEFFQKLMDFTEKNVAQEIIDQDLNTLLPNEKFRMIRKNLKQETLMFLRDELKHVSQ